MSCDDPLVTGWPLTDTMRSPACRIPFAGALGSPAVHALLAAAVTQGWTAWTFAGPLTTVGQISSAAKNSTRAITKCIVEPATSTMSRCQPGLLINARG